MYSRQEASQLRQEFWTAFGQYMAPLPSADGLKVNWVNYKTGIKDIYFRMNADNRKASISIDITHKDTGVQALYYEQFQQLKLPLQEALGESWNWQLHTPDEWGNQFSRIYIELPGVNIFKREDWPELISFFKPRIRALDEFWSMAKYSFEALM
jgi:hypothetical protein